MKFLLIFLNIFIWVLAVKTDPIGSHGHTHADNDNDNPNKIDNSQNRHDSQSKALILGLSIGLPLLAFVLITAALIVYCKTTYKGSLSPRLRLLRQSSIIRPGQRFDCGKIYETQNKKYELAMNNRSQPSTLYNQRPPSYKLPVLYQSNGIDNLPTYDNWLKRPQKELSLTRIDTD